MSFKTQRELFLHLCNGGKVRKIGEYQTYLLNDLGNLVLEDGYSESCDFDYPNLWEPYIEPKPKKKVTLYRYTYLNTNGGYKMQTLMQTFWTSGSFEKYRRDFAFVGELLMTEEKTIEVEQND